MQNRYAQIQFIAANYSRLQGLRAVPVGMLVIFASVWAMYNQGDLGVPLVAVVGSILLYWLIDHYYANVFGRIKQTQNPNDKIEGAKIGLIAGGMTAAWLIGLMTGNMLVFKLIPQ